MLFFDLDGTLLDSNGVWLDIDIAFLGRHGVTPVPEDYTWYVTHHSAPDSARYTRERFHLSETAEDIQSAWLDMAREAYAQRLELKPGARALLERCRREALPMAVLTSCIPELCRAALSRHGILDWFQGIVFAQETQSSAASAAARSASASAPRRACCLRTPPATAPPPGRRAFLWSGCGTPCTPDGRGRSRPAATPGRRTSAALPLEAEQRLFP